MRRTVLFAVFHRLESHVVIGSQDMMQIQVRHAKCLNYDADRWDDKKSEWTITTSEAHSLADAVADMKYLPGKNLVSVRYSDTATGTEIDKLQDGLDGVQRAESLITFLRGGQCQWRFITAEDLAKEFTS